MSAKRTKRAKRVCAFRANDTSRFIACCIATLAFALALLFLLPCRAYGDEVDSLDVEFIESLAVKSGLDPGSFVVTAVTTASYSTGIPLFKTTAKLDDDLATALGHLVDAADYPDWDTLDQGQQSIYGNKKNYDASKFNHLMAAFGYESAYEEFKGSGGGNLDLSKDLESKLGVFGRIASTWMAGGANSVRALVDTVSDIAKIKTFPVSSSSVLSFEPQGSYYPSSYPDSIGVNQGYGFFYSNTRVWVVSASSEVFYLVYWNTSNRSFEWLMFSLGNFTVSYGFEDDPQIVRNANQKTKGNDVFYTYGLVSAYSAGSTLDPSVVTVPFRLNTGSFNDNLVHEFLFEADVVAGDSDERIPGYPEDGVVNPEQETYFPEQGLDKDTTWPIITTSPGEPVAPRPENPFNPGNQTQDPKWKNETTQNVIELGNLPFDKLFPFCLLYDVPLLLDKIMGSTSGMRAQGRIDYTVIQMRFPDFDGIGLQGFEITLDLDPLQEVLNMVRPVFQIMIIALLLFTAIEFWKSIITG